MDARGADPAIRRHSVTRPPKSAVHLDTSFLIRSLVPGSDESVRLRGWLLERRPVAVSTLVWGEFLCGPLDDEDHARALRLAHRRVPLGTEEASRAASLFNQAGQRRGSFADCLVAATAILAGAELATSDGVDFERFTDAGLRLA